MGGEEDPMPDEEGTDTWALRRGMISVTPIQMNMTAAAFLEEMTRRLADVRL
jgi:5'-nucleotidase